MTLYDLGTLPPVAPLGPTYAMDQPIQIEHGVWALPQYRKEAPPTELPVVQTYRWGQWGEPLGTASYSRAGVPGGVPTLTPGYVHRNGAIGGGAPALTVSPWQPRLLPGAAQAALIRMGNTIERTSLAIDMPQDANWLTGSPVWTQDERPDAWVQIGAVMRNEYRDGSSDYVGSGIYCAGRLYPTPGWEVATTEVFEGVATGWASENSVVQDAAFFEGFSGLGGDAVALYRDIDVPLVVEVPLPGQRGRYRVMAAPGVVPESWGQFDVKVEIIGRSDQGYDFSMARTSGSYKDVWLDWTQTLNPDPYEETPIYYRIEATARRQDQSFAPIRTWYSVGHPLRPSGSGLTHWVSGPLGWSRGTRADIGTLVAPRPIRMGVSSAYAVGIATGGATSSIVVLNRATGQIVTRVRTEHITAGPLIRGTKLLYYAADPAAPGFTRRVVVDLTTMAFTVEQTENYLIQHAAVAPSYLTDIPRLTTQGVLLMDDDSLDLGLELEVPSADSTDTGGGGTTGVTTDSPTFGGPTFGQPISTGGGGGSFTGSFSQSDLQRTTLSVSANTILATTIPALQAPIVQRSAYYTPVTEGGMVRAILWTGDTELDFGVHRSRGHFS